MTGNRKFEPRRKVERVAEIPYGWFGKPIEGEPRPDISEFGQGDAVPIADPETLPVVLEWDIFGRGQIIWYFDSSAVLPSRWQRWVTKMALGSKWVAKI